MGTVPGSRRQRLVDFAHLSDDTLNASVEQSSRPPGFARLGAASSRLRPSPSAFDDSRGTQDKPTRLGRGFGERHCCIQPASRRR